MDVIIEFVGGLLDGQQMLSDSSDPIEAHKVQRLAQVIGGTLASAERQERPYANCVTYRHPSPPVMEQAKAEEWSHARIRAVMPYHEYEFSHYHEADGIAHIFLRYKGLSR